MGAGRGARMNISISQMGKLRHRKVFTCPRHTANTQQDLAQDPALNPSLLSDSVYCRSPWPGVAVDATPSQPASQPETLPHSAVAASPQHGRKRAIPRLLPPSTRVSLPPSPISPPPPGTLTHTSQTQAWFNSFLSPDFSIQAG